MEKLVAALERKRGDTSVVEFARDMNISPATYYRWLRGERGMGADILKRVLSRYPELGLEFIQGIET